MRPLEFGCYLPTHGDTTAYGLMDAQIPGSPELCDRVVQAAESAGFEYLLIPVGSVCWEAWITGAFMAARSSTIKPLIAVRPGYINPVLLAKMISTFDQMAGGRICINLIAGQNESEVEGEGVRYGKEERYALMEEEVSILKALWTTRGPLNFEGKFHTLSGAHIRPRHASWFTPEVNRWLTDQKISRVAADPARAANADRPGGWEDLSYFRLHGAPRIYYSAYEDDFLERLAGQLAAISVTNEVWCTFDNTAIGAAMGNVVSLQACLAPKR